MKIIDLFSGAGGFHIGFEEAGFEIGLAIDNNVFVEKYHLNNFPHIPFLREDIRNIPSETIFSIIGHGEIAGIVGSTPCQGFTSKSNSSHSDLEKDNLIMESLRLVNEIKPKFFVMETVNQFLYLNKGDSIKELCKEINQMGYSCDFKVMNMADYGVPQQRKRLFIIGIRGGEEISFPYPTHSENGMTGLSKWETCWSAIHDLENTPEDPSVNHIFTERFKGSPNNQLLNNRHKKRVNRRLDKQKPSLTINGADPLIHPTLDRKLTIRELARIQTFPDQIVFYGERRKQHQLVGATVPPLFSFQLATHLMNIFDEIKSVREAIRTCPVSDGKSFEKVVRNFLKICFKNIYKELDLDEQVRSEEGLSIKDFIIYNSRSSNDFLNHLRTNKKVELLLFEAKNYKDPLSYTDLARFKNYIDDNPHFGNFGIVISRNGIDDNCKRNIDLQLHKGIYILILSEGDLYAMLDELEMERDPINIIEAKYKQMIKKMP